MTSISLDTGPKPATWFVQGVPDPDLGNNGDTAINELAGTIYGPKTGGDWGTARPFTAAAGSGSSTITTVNGIAGPDITLLPGDVGADPYGSAASAQTNAEAYTDTQLVGIMRVFETTIGDGSSSSFLITHGLNRFLPEIKITEVASPYAIIQADYVPTDNNSGTITLLTGNPVPASNAWNVIVIG